MSGIGTCAGKAGKEGSLGTLSTGHPMTAELQHAPWIIKRLVGRLAKTEAQRSCGSNEGHDLLRCSEPAPDYQTEMRCQDPIAAPTQACSHCSTPTPRICHLPNLGLQSIFNLHELLLGATPECG